MIEAPAGTSDDERCSLCPPAGPPTFASLRAQAANEQPSDEAPKPSADDIDHVTNLVWIACSRCQEWFHSSCLLLAGDEVRETVPAAVREEVETNHKDESPFFDWTVWIDRWYCKACLDKSRDPSNPTRLHHPLAATTKPNFPPRENKRKSSGGKGSSSTASLDGSLPAGKKAKLETPDVTAQPGAEEDGSASSSRPKRQAALNRPDYHALHHHISTPTGKWLDLIANPEKYNTTILDGDFPRVKGDMVTRRWIEASIEGVAEAGPSRSTPPGSMFYGATREPLIVRPEDGGFESMGGKLPGKDFSVQDVARLVGLERSVDVIDVATQSSSQWTLKQWADYVKTGTDPNGNSSKVYNIISLEVTGTDLAKKIRAPQLVRDIDWVDNFWHFPGGKGNVVDEKKREVPANAPVTDGATDAVTPDLKAKGKAPSTWPKVQLYCLMGTKGSWTDWHVDFAASSVYYTIHSGSKVFYFIRPTERNLKAYSEWSGSYEMQQNTWLGDLCDEVRRVVLVQGDTMIIPAGYIHAVYTPMNSIVFGGNFVHSYDIPTQLRLRQIEIDTKVPQRFRFPFFDRLCWYVADRYCSELRQCRQYRPRSSTSPTPPHPIVLDGLVHLAKFLITQADILENPDEEDKKRAFVHNKVPQEIVKDPSGLARELLWRVKRELGEEAEDEIKPALNGHASAAAAANGKADPKNGTLSRKSKKMPIIQPRSRTTAFSPPPWEQTDLPLETSEKTVEVPRPLASQFDAHPGDQAQQSVIHRRQVRSRTKDLDDGTTVVEKQEVLFTETRWTWFSRPTEIKTETATTGPAVK